MTATWFTSDLHFGHRMVADLRGFGNTADHDQAVIDNWNMCVGVRDTVWLLGDVAMKWNDNTVKCVDALNGTIHLISGNHDQVWPGHRNAHKWQVKYLSHFASVQPFARIRVEGTNVLLSHFPYGGDHTEQDRYSRYRLQDDGLPLLHGHTHSANRHDDPAKPRQIHVGLDSYDLMPVPLHVIASLVKTAPTPRKEVG